MKTISFLMFCLVCISPLYADYSKMNQVKEDYTPPAYFSDALEFKLESQGSVIEADKNSSDVFSSIEKIKDFYIKKINKNHEILFLSDMDARLFTRMADISSDSKSVKKIIHKNIILQEIEVLAGLRNPGVLAARKQVKAEIESFNQVMDLDKNLKQYSAFTEGMVEKMNITQKNVITQIRKAYWDIVFIGKSIEITSETIDAFNRLKGVATALYKSGKTSFQDIIKINIKIEILKEDLVTLASK